MSGTTHLLLTEHTPALGTGHGLRTYAIARALAAHGPLEILHPTFGAPEPDAAFAAIPGARFTAVAPTRGLARGLAYWRARAAGVPPGFARGVSPELVGEARRRAAGVDRVIADGPVAAAALRGLARRRPVIYNAHNLESAFRPGRRAPLARFERGLLRHAAETWMVSPADVESARALCPDARLRYVPNVVDVEGTTPVEPVTGGPALLAGDFGYPPNRGALAYMLEEILPRAPEARLLVIGRGEPDARGDDRVEVAGFVEDLRAAYARASCVVVPLLEGGGSPLKFVEALAYGLPVVATPRAAAGLEAVPGEHFLLGADPDQFAAALREAIAGHASRIAAAGRRLAEDRYSLSAITSAVAP
jgi:glycosyltransferase involved in cell wall biosynthesis